MQKSIRNKVNCGGTLKPREATHTVGVSWYGFAPGKAPVVEHLSSSQTAKTSKQTVPKEPRKETPTGQGECGWNPRGESIKEVNPLILYMKSHKSQPDP